jgi:sugar phosphate isomerase/epimerase
LRIGVIIDSFRLGVKGGIRKAASLGVDGFQIWATSGEMAPENLTQTGRHDFLHFVESQGLEVSALCGHLRKASFSREEGLEERIDRTKQIFDLAHDLRVPVVTTHVGLITQEADAPDQRRLRDALTELGQYGEKRGVALGAETGPEDARVMAEVFRSLPTEGIRANYDPANLLMHGFDEVQGVRDLDDLIIHTHAKDGIRDAEGKGHEVPLGEGGVRWEEYLGALEDIRYDGFLTIEREVGDDPVGDITAAVAFLRQF